MELHPNDITGMRVALWSGRGEPITTLTVPVGKAKADFGNLETPQYNVAGIPFFVDSRRNNFGGTTFGNQLILDTHEVNRSNIATLASIMTGQLSIEVMEKPARGDTGGAVVVTRKQLEEMSEGAHVTERKKNGPDRIYPHL